MFPGKEMHRLKEAQTARHGRVEEIIMYWVFSLRSPVDGIGQRTLQMSSEQQVIR